MKRVLITGANSYIGTMFEQWMSQYPDQYFIDTIDTRGEEWKKKDFSSFDAIFHVAGIAHADTGRASKETKKLYYRVNCNLAFKMAKKAKADGVKQFVFMSSIIVYGGKIQRITMDTVPRPYNFYGDSKLQAEKKLKTLADESFQVAILRPPMIYGKNCKGNYPMLSKIARKAPFFPNVDNQRSMLYIDNLCEFVRLMIENEEEGLFFPQNEDYVRTSELVKMIATVHGKKIILIRSFNPILRRMCKHVGIVGKAFGSMAYERKMSEYKVNYRVVNFFESIQQTEL